MTNRITIVNELIELGSALGNHTPQNIYAVPNGYFEGLPAQIINRIKALEAKSAGEELELISPLLSNVSKEMPYAVPVGFFQDFGIAVMDRINGNVNHQTSKEEIESLSPLLSSVRKKNPYSVPSGYFDTLETSVEKNEAKVIFITYRRLYRVAVAAVVIGIVAIGGLLFINPNVVDPNKNPQAWIEKNVNKKVSTDKIDELVTLVNDENGKPVDENENAKQAEIKEMMKDVPEKEIEDFLNDAVASNSNDGDATLMN